MNTSDKPRIFVSHATEDAYLVKQLVDTLNSFFATGVNVEATSIAGTIPSGEPWFEWITSRLNSATAIIFVLTPNSLHKPWIWFELGATWLRHENKQVVAIPVCCCVKLEQLGPPLNQVQGIDLTNTNDVQALLKQLYDKFELGTDTRKFASKIQRFASKYCETTQSLRQGMIPTQAFVNSMMRLATLQLISETAIDVLIASDLIAPEIGRQLRTSFSDPK